MKKVFTGILCLGSIASFAQDKRVKFNNEPPEPAAVVTAHLEKTRDGDTVWLFEPWSGDTAMSVIKNHRFQLRMPMPKGGSMYIMQIGSVPEKDAAVVYLEDGKMDIKGKGRNFDDAKFSGAAYVKEWQEVNAIIDPFSGDGKLLADLYRKYGEARAVGDEEACEAIFKDAGVIDKRMKDKLKDWMYKHPNSGICGYILTVYFMKERKYFDSVYNTLGDHAKAQRILMRWKYPGKIDPPRIELGKAEGATGNIAGKPKVGTQVPDFEIPDLAGKKVKLSDFKGKYVFIDFWASWCGPCIRAIPEVKKLQQKFKDKGLVFMGVSLDTKREGWEKAINKYELDWVNVSHLQGWGEPVSRMFGVRAVPSNALIGPDGKVVANDVFGEALVKLLEEKLN